MEYLVAAASIVLADSQLQLLGIPGNSERMPLRYLGQCIEGCSGRPADRQPLRNFALHEGNDRTYRTKGGLRLGVGSRLTDIGTMGPRSSGIRVDILGIDVTHLPDRVEYTGKVLR